MSVLISIIIPTFNSEATVEVTLESIVNQTYKNIEVLVMDGVSEDTTCEIVREFVAKHSFITLVPEKDNGVYDAMNKGIELCKGDYFYFMGSDDVFYDNATLAKIVNHISSEDDFLYGNVMFKESNLIYSGASNFNKLYYDQISICHQAIFYSKRVFELVGNYNLKYFIHADYDFNIRCFADKRIKKRFISETIAVFNEKGMSGTESNADGFHTELTEKILKEKYTLIDLYKKNKELKKEIEVIKKSKNFRLGYLILRPIRKIKRLFK